ncbi:MAG: hypothetical protein CL608_29665 [Anaerolineaceae bacterium]|nr:hypothetical protein [Anaerolineaceae bacterium]
MSGDFEKNPEVSSQAAPEADEYTSRRARYLLGTLRLEHDPFCAPTAELELQINPEDSPFFSYFVDPPYRLTGTRVRQPLLDHLKQPQPSCVYGQAGTGKTAVKTMLEAECRALPEQTLVLSLGLGKGEPVQLDEAFLWQRLTEALAIDLFVQVIEQFDSLHKMLKPALVAELSRFWQAHIPQFRRTVRRELLRAESETADISTWWRVWDRPVIRYTPLTAGRKQFVEVVLAETQGKRGKVSLMDGRSQFQQGLKLAEKCDYERLYLLIDVPGGTRPNELDIAELLRFLSDLTDLSLPIYTKLFFPQSFQPDAEYLFVEENMTLELFTAVLNWNQPRAFQKLLEQRFRTAGSWIRNLNTIIEQPVVAEINKLLQQEANQSPRFLLQTISRLIDSHANHAPDIFLITLEDWQRMVARWGEVYKG